MIVIPAIDIKDGKVVRLQQGQFDKITEYSSDPVGFAKKWEEQGAGWLHVIDLNGAEVGNLKNFELIRAIKKETNIKIQLGGGIRNKSLVTMLLDKKNHIEIDRIIIGTSAIKVYQQELKLDAEFLSDVVSRWGDKIGVSLDCINGYIAYRGWTETTNIKGVELAKGLENIGVKTVVYTDIARDGMLTGPNFDGLGEILNAVKINVIASGGISKIEDIQKLLDLKAKNLYGAITGKAIYEGKLDLKKAVELCSQNA